MRGHWFAVFENPNSDWVLTNLVFEITVFDSTQSVISTRVEKATFIPPSGQIAISGFEGEPGEGIASLEIEASWESETPTDTYTGDWVVTDMTTVHESFGSTFTGAITSTFGKAFDLATVTVVLFDSAHSPIWADTTIVDISPEQETAFVVEMYQNPPYESFEVFARP